MKKDKKRIYYSDAANDDFAGNNINGINIDGKYKYIHKGRLWRACAFFCYRIIAFPLVWFFERVILGMRFVGRENMRKLGDKSAFLYGNHIGFYDAFTPNLISYPRRNMIVTSPDAVSIKGLGEVVKMMGALPIPSDLASMRNFREALKYYNGDSNITIYPEAHIWPYYTGIRDFSDASFAYPAELGAPIVAFFTAFSEPRGIVKLFRSANITVYVSEPIFPNPELSKREARRELRDKAYAFMKECSEKHSTYEVIEYRRAEDTANNGGPEAAQEAAAHATKEKGEIASDAKLMSENEEMLKNRSDISSETRKSA